MTKNKRKKILYSILMFIFIGISGLSIFFLLKYYVDIKKSEDKFKDLKNMIIMEEFDNNSNSNNTSEVDNSDIHLIDVNGILIQKKYKNIFELNTDFIGWIKIKNTNIDYPVMQSNYDEEFYLRRNFEKEHSESGTLFVDLSSSIDLPSDNILIYGHNMKSKTMFHDLLKYEDEDFYLNNKYFYFDTIFEDGKYEVIAAFKTHIPKTDFVGFRYFEFFDATNEVEYNYYIDNIKKLTPYKTNDDISFGDKLVTLSTCAYHTKDGRFVVVGKKIN